MSGVSIWLALGLLAVAALLPLAITLLGPARARGRGEADLGLYRAQLAELAREKEAGRLDAAAHRAAVLEVQRRLLAAPAEAGPAEDRRSRWVLAAALVAVPGLALGLYLRSGIPDMPSAPFALRHEIAARDDRLLDDLRVRLGQLPPESSQAREGWTLLGNAERGRGRLAAAAEAYRKALAGGFDADLTGQLAQVLLEEGRNEEAQALLAAALPRAQGHVGLRFLAGLAEAQAGRPESAKAAWRALIADAPPEAPWRAMVERRLNALP
ncbi:c-type cytochrome biogenesis protein CcmI [Roseicella frigidaeris]|uniref:C-type cytochrome biogenesis protein CcmI n=1 Tax=Roseicella frigidaeris TaxID=2230885 RepID=A0A327M441_9PROT|nr:c-type cytochrome biogenesis protein CcmI [Roseicella frigidaeris]RAI57135.1 c-type cytochrome biogenesis protein CcmI [Roseicella frigidaeris]